MFEVVLLFLTAVLALLAITGYDQYLITKVRARVVKEKLRVGFGEGVSVMEDDPLTRMRVKKVKAAKVGSYLVVTLVISDEGKGGEKIEVEDPTLLLPLITDEENYVTS
ncbi:MAG: hypothetical protein J7L55_03465 [Desulfurococcales archaeon]|nr:hypothetical protein [Desulfurococcales archaeon]